MTIRRTRLASWAVAATILMSLGVVFAPVAQASTTDSMNAWLLSSINSDRDAVGLRALRLDSRLAALANERANYMAGTGQLSHPKDIGAAVESVGVRPYFAGEAIGDTNASFGIPAVQYIYNLWRGSSEHWGLITSDRFNYIGVGVAYSASSGQTFSSLVFAEAPDSSAPVASITRLGPQGLDDQHRLGGARRPSPDAHCWHAGLRDRLSSRQPRLEDASLRDDLDDDGPDASIERPHLHDRGPGAGPAVQRVAMGDSHGAGPLITMTRGR